MLCLVAALLLAFAGVVPPANAGSTGHSDRPGRFAGGEEQKKGSHQNDFLLFGNIFTEQGLSLPGAIIRVRRAGESKVRWEAHSDRRGEFAVRVPRGPEYEMSVTAPGYQEQTRKVDTKNGDREDLIFHMTSAKGGKKP